MRAVLVLLCITMHFVRDFVISVEMENYFDLYTCLQTTLGGIKNATLWHRDILPFLETPDTNTNFEDPPHLPGEFRKENGTKSHTQETLPMPTHLNTSRNNHSREVTTKDFDLLSLGLELLTVPKLILQERIRYLLFTKRNIHEYQVMAEDGSVEGTYWNARARTKVLIHGLTSTYWFPPVRNIWSQHIFDIKDAYLKDPSNMEFNVIVVDWTPLSTVPLSQYPDAAKSTRLAGIDLAKLLRALNESGNILTWKDVHILGHSLGAHVAGVTGNKLQEMDKHYVIERITGMDPAGLCFDTMNKEPTNLLDLLDKSDAKFVDIIHTNMGNIVTSGAGRYGSMMELGHADFYPNGGVVQPGCSFIEDRLEYCSHRKSVAFYALSIAMKRIACPCNDWELYRSSSQCDCDVKSGGQNFGEDCDSSARGRFFLSGW